MIVFHGLTFRRDSHVHEVRSRDAFPIPGTTYGARCGACVRPAHRSDLVTTCPKCLRRARAEKEAPCPTTGS